MRAPKLEAATKRTYCSHQRPPRAKEKLKRRLRTKLKVIETQIAIATATRIGMCA